MGATVDDVVLVAATVEVVVGASVVVEAATVVVLPGTVVVLPTTVVVVGGSVVVVSTTVVVVGGSVVVVSTTVVVVDSGTVVVVVTSGSVVVVTTGAVVVVTGGRTAVFAMDLSSLPALQFATLEQAKSSTRMWYGDPEMDAADLSTPQSACEATWPPQESTTVLPTAVKYTFVEVEELSVYSPVREYGVGLAATVQVEAPHRFPVFAMDAPGAGKVPPSIRNAWPGTWVTPRPVTSGSMGIGSVETGAAQERPEQGSAVVSVRATPVR
jgi:hypothetical protein